jgi:hypothetical protein
MNPPTVIIVSATQLTIDGVAFSNPIDTAINRPPLRPLIQTALVAWEQSLRADWATGIASAQAERDAAVAAAQAERDAALTAKTKALSDLAEHQQLVDGYVTQMRANTQLMAIPAIADAIAEVSVFTAARQRLAAEAEVTRLAAELGAKRAALQTLPS